MIFTEARFLLFFAVVLAVYWSLRNGRHAKTWLLLCSYVFYGAWDWRFLFLIAASTLVDFKVGLALGDTSDERRRRRWLQLSLVANLGLLAAFKYFDFFVQSGAALLEWLGLSVSVGTLGFILPVGISFYTFQTMSYSLDVYRRRIEPTRDLQDLALFVGFFPQLVAGPIVRARDFLPQLATRPRFGQIDVRAALVLFLIGYFKKAVLSDGVAGTVDAYFAEPAAYDALSAWSGVALYAVQIYCDFSGYSDMAIGCAALLGYNLCRNFDAPYLAASVTDFWRRWHISLSTWLRDYLYIPLGGSRGSTLFTWRNLMLTMLLGGLWHGAAWRFVFWGALHGVALIAHRVWSGGGTATRRLPQVLGVALTLWWVGLAWIFFRAADMPSAWTVARGYVLLDSPGEGQLGDRLLMVAIGLLAVQLVARSAVLREWWRRPAGWAFAAGYGAAGALVLALLHPHAEAFIYFQF
jgi:alginate O-acetyltransferase complex protein AlgI